MGPRRKTRRLPPPLEDRASQGPPTPLQGQRQEGSLTICFLKSIYLPKTPNHTRRQHSNENAIPRHAMFSAKQTSSWGTQSGVLSMPAASLGCSEPGWGQRGGAWTSGRLDTVRGSPAPGGCVSLKKVTELCWDFVLPLIIQPAPRGGLARERERRPDMGNFNASRKT